MNNGAGHLALRMEFFNSPIKATLYAELLLGFYKKDYSQDGKEYVGDPGS